ncbi:MAG: T9SS type A sorting domain-containing protein [Saprospiraceae bacterium]|nr:T9SS type A sorting domain-containing protein [Saprospiraceae bacterium]
MEGFHENGWLSISDLNGRTVYRRQVQPSDTNFELNEEQFFPGMYLVTLQNDRGRIIRKLVVE